ncbi:hypothetical protein M378DRAFT_170490 [Amanita muscaria Koide BX008]|uniref:Protein kinase domain-containing protein n=1 Tax=Amanita muscaria (strain Koide BX008) TaxID=946122 RepID=A0A0C2WP93_AMAMK|nr:hypothetical protein M378DRAFT_170490 [Amanita muscaria Koide BX008]
MTLHDFLVEYAKFPFPHHDEPRTMDTTDISEIAIGLLEREWKARHAVRDNHLVQKLCHSLENILGDTPFVAGSERYFSRSFSPRLQVDESGTKNSEWDTNPSEVHSRTLLDKGFFEAARKCFGNFGFGPYPFEAAKERCVTGGSSKVDYIFLINGEPTVLCEAESPLVMMKVSELLPPHGIELKWVPGQSVVPKIISKAALYLGLRHMEWLFLTCHNYWIVCRLVRDDIHPYLAYSPAICIKDSSEPFRAFLGAILSRVVKVPVEPSAYSPDLELDIIEEESPLPEHDIDDDSPSRAHDEHENTESGLIVTSSSPNSPEDFHVWVHLYSMSNNTLVLPQCARSSKQRLWLTRFVASGSTGNVWQCRFDNCDELFAVKVVEMLRLSDAGSRQRLRNEFKVYLTLDKAYKSGQICDRIAPRCYGAFEGDRMDVLILDLCDGILNDWEELSAAERSQIYKLVQDLHRIGIVHGDLEPRNIGRARGGGFCLIDFSESRRHNCKESKVSEPGTQPAPKTKCPELQTLRNYLWKGQPLGPPRN